MPNFNFTRHIQILMNNLIEIIVSLFYFIATSQQSSDLIGLFLHGCIALILSSTLTCCIGIILRPTMDHSYLWFRPVTLLSPTAKIFCRILILLPTLFHCFLIMFGAAIIIVNMLLSLKNKVNNLIIFAEKINGKLGLRGIAQYLNCMRTYSQLSLITVHMNEFLYYILLVAFAG